MTNLTLTSESLSLSNPGHILEFSSVLKHYIKENSLTERILNKDYVLVKGWQFAALNFGLSPLPHEPKQHNSGDSITSLMDYAKVYKTNAEKLKVFHATLDGDNISKQMIDRAVRTEIMPYYKYSCKCDVISIITGMIISSGSSVCTNLEVKKRTAEEFVIASMSQTRAIGKSIRNVLGFVMEAAGFESTPAEDMVDPVESEIQPNLDEKKELVKMVVKKIPKIETIDQLTEFYRGLDEWLRKNNDILSALKSRKTELTND